MCAMIFKRKNDYTKEARKCQHLFSKKEKKTYIKICLKIEESLLKYLKIMYNLKKNRGCSSKLFVIHPKEKITSKINLAGVLRQRRA